VTGALADSAVNDRVAVRLVAKIILINLFEFLTGLESAVVISRRFPRDALCPGDMATADHALLRILPWTSSYTGNSVPSIQAAVLAGLGVSVLGAHSVQNGMRVVQDELPNLPSIDIMLFGEEKFGGAIAKALVNFVLRSVQEQENLMAKAA
jgi:DNA-binding transcriptional LysR family regulator